MTITKNAPQQNKVFTLEQITNASLRPEYAQILKLATAPQDYARIAMLLNVPVGTVKSRLSRARAALNKELASEE